MSVAVQSERGSASSQYDLLARLAEGGMAEIFLARAKSMAGFERYVVLKMIRPERGEDPQWVTMFLDEARVAAQLQHPNIAHVFDLGRIGDAYFYTMEYVHGEDVLDIQKRTAALGQIMPINVALAITTGAAAGLAHAHNRCAPDGTPLGIVHRDVSPSNLMVSYEGSVKILDFGVAKARFRNTQTQAGTIMGKVAYLSPEQGKTLPVDQRSDIFSLGIVLYELLTQTRPFKRVNDYETIRAIVRETPPLPSSIVANLPIGLDDVVMTALAKDPNDRYENITQMFDAIEDVAETEGLTLSQGVLRRFMRDLWGSRPEPWRELGEPQESTGSYSGPLFEQLPHTLSVYSADFKDALIPPPGEPGTRSGADLDAAISFLQPSAAAPLPPPVAVPELVIPPRTTSGTMRAVSGPIAATSAVVHRRSLITAIAAVVIAMALAFVIFFVLGGGSSTATDVSSPAKPIVTPIDTPKPAVAAPIEPPVAPTPAPAPVKKKLRAATPADPKDRARGSDDRAHGSDARPPDPPPVRRKTDDKKPATAPCPDPLDCQF